MSDHVFSAIYVHKHAQEHVGPAINPWISTTVLTCSSWHTFRTLFERMAPEELLEVCCIAVFSWCHYFIVHLSTSLKTHPRMMTVTKSVTKVRLKLLKFRRLKNYQLTPRRPTGHNTAVPHRQHCLLERTAVANHSNGILLPHHHTGRSGNLSDMSYSEG